MPLSGSSAMRLALLALTPILPALAACAQPAVHPLQTGDRYEITTNRETSEQSSDGLTSSSSDRDTITARVIAVRDDGVEWEYDFPKDASPEERASSWQLPARIFRPDEGPIQLLNRAELEARVDRWLKTGGMTRAACGHWIFTWNAFRIDCDPDSAIAIVESYDPAPFQLREGASYNDRDALSPAPLRRGADGNTFVVQLAIDPERVREARVESDLSAAEISRKTLTPEDARRAHADEAIAGTIAITFQINSAGEVQRRTRVTTLKIAIPNGRSDTRKVTETTVRRLLPS